MLLEILKEFDIANKYMNVAIGDLNNELNPLDIFYNLLKCDIKVLNDDFMRNTIIESVARTHGPTHDKYKLKVK